MVRRKLPDGLLFLSFVLMPTIMASWTLFRFPYLVRPASRVLVVTHLLLAGPLFLGLETLGGKGLAMFLFHDLQGAAIVLYLLVLLARIGFSVALFGEVIEARKTEH